MTVHVRQEGAVAVLLVEDNGPGIAHADRERVFERFCRLENSRSDGCGLGLAIVREIARAHAAEVALETAGTGRGLAARLRLALA